MNNSDKITALENKLAFLQDEVSSLESKVRALETSQIDTLRDLQKVIKVVLKFMQADNN